MRLQWQMVRQETNVFILGVMNFNAARTFISILRGSMYQLSLEVIQNTKSYAQVFQGKSLWILILLKLIKSNSLHPSSQCSASELCSQNCNSNQETWDYHLQSKHISSIFIISVVMCWNIYRDYVIWYDICRHISVQCTATSTSVYL